jgi:acyl-[acyl-carrier-protein]-phospholipid O-acyltransferase/long-chain-fatty-acid--[acyl-carrier-protein] ligase
MNMPTKKIAIGEWTFIHLNVTQFLGALNDQVYKWLLVYLLIDLKGPEYANTILAISGAVFVIPFVVFSSVCGKLADNHSKTYILRLSKFLEIVIMALGVAAFYVQNEWVCYGVLFLMAAQSTLFSPAKYGILPELFEDNHIPAANGWLSLFTNVAIIMGAFLASWIAEVTGKNFILAGYICIGLAVIGTITSLYIPKSASAKQNKRLHLSFWREVLRTLKLTQSIPYLTSVILGNAFFYVIAGYCQLNVIAYALVDMHESELMGGYLSPAMAIGIGIGSLLAGKLSKGTTRLDFIWKGALAVGLCFGLLQLTSHSILLTFLALMLLGICGGFYIVPTDSYVQLNTPIEHRGEMIGSSNVLAFTGVMLGSLLISLLGDGFSLTPKEGFAVVGFLSAILALVLYRLIGSYSSQIGRLKE